MSNLSIVRAWKDPDYRRSLTAEQQAQVPAHPAGAIEIEEGLGVMTISPRTHSPCRRCGSSKSCARCRRRN